jgi:hypothetical protein
MVEAFFGFKETPYTDNPDAKSAASRKFGGTP